MQTQPLTILAIDDNPADVGILRRRLQQVEDLQCELMHCADTHSARDTLAAHRVDCLFLDYHLGTHTGLEFLTDLRASGNDVPVITLTGQGNEAVAVEAMKLGAQDYLAKANLTPESLRLAIDNAIGKVALTRKLAETQEELRQFAATAAHDLKAPLRRVRQFCQRIQDTCQVKLSGEENELLDFVVQNAEQMHHLIEALLEYARVGRSETPLEPVDLSRIMTSVTANLAALLEESQGRIDIGDLPWVHGDATALMQLFQNLIANALKFRGDTTPLVTVNSQREGDRWRVSVADTGIGIAPEHLDNIFAPFRRLHGPSEYEGSGIGLATCRKIVDQHHGAIWVESDPGHGATFHVTLAAGTQPEIDCKAV